MAHEVLEVESAKVAVMDRPPRAQRDHQSPQPSSEPATFFEASRSQSPTMLSAPETERMHEIQRSAERDPQAYMEACRAEAR